MADALEPAKNQSMDEIRTWEFDFTPDILSGLTISSATGIHTPPSGSASTVAVGTISGFTVPVTLGTLSVTGQHYLECLATFSDTEKSSVRIKINVPY